MVHHHIPVLIIGGGIAGSVAALGMHKAGLKVIVLDARTQPRRKLCGEFLCFEGVEFLKNAGLESLTVGPWARPRACH